ncbi:hypothetical protein tloyanaT_11560 [Thalassotalea loyana]|uniref:Transglutaminase-like domain-containing protein n=1 Tax=Thalassotalea loyana TaxID=280483 RepID=A0ABQ6HBT6_9GAMM|nr:DUF3488 and transglutaminase-like domain-containing protein [Thalassotalea loyana]GLX84904.1 hypothetical protein tloyanaT_11560 [Thalassotalea loyana]
MGWFSRAKRQSMVLPKELQLVMLLVAFANFAFLASQLSSWFVVLDVVILANYYFGFSRPKLRRKAVVFGFTLLGIITLIILSKPLGLMLTMVNLLVFSHVMKLYEQNIQRDFYTFNLLSFIVVATAMLFYQSLWFFILLLLLLILSLIPLLLFNKYQTSVQQNNEVVSFDLVKAHTVLLSKMVLISIPLAIFLFFIFPRLQPFAAIPQVKMAKTGLSDEVSVGDIGQLVRSDELAFQVEFEEGITPKAPMYWRALVMEYFDGVTWQSAEKNPKFSNIFRNKDRYLSFVESRTENIVYIGESINYQVYVRPSYQQFLFALDVAQPKSSGVSLLADRTIISEKPISQKFAYEVTSYPNLKIDSELPDLVSAINLAIPSETNPNLQAYAQTIVNKYQGQSNQQQMVIDDILTTFREQPYYYTLNPPILTGDRLDQFFFESKAGFCVHYASTFTFLMRAAGIPARMVTGYLGGEYHEQGQFFSIRQKDAHAWTEVWLENRGWVRIDPTAAVSPERIEQGIDAALLQEQGFLNQGFFNNVNWLNGTLLLRIRGTFELIDYQWTKYIVGFSSKKQSRLLRQLFGDKQYWKVGLAIAGVLTILFLFFYLFTQVNWRSPKKPLHVVYYERLQKYMKRQVFLADYHNELEQPDITVRAYCQRISAIEPRYKLVLHGFLSAFEAIQYQPLTEQQRDKKNAQLLQLLKQITELK